MWPYGRVIPFQITLWFEFVGEWAIITTVSVKLGQIHPFTRDACGVDKRQQENVIAGVSNFHAASTSGDNSVQCPKKGVGLNTTICVLPSPTPRNTEPGVQMMSRNAYQMNTFDFGATDEFLT